jgi:ribosomal-protein-alanine N-acetyltransferase
MKIVVMSRHVLEVYIRKVVELDALMLSTLGRDYSETGWTEENFRYDLPFKWELSRLAVNGERMAGFWIASASVPGNCHTHRVAVHPAYQGQGIGRAMFEALARDARAHGPGVETMTLEVGYGNCAAKAFYRELGFESLQRDAIRAYLRARGRAATVLDDCLEEADLSRFSVLERRLGGHKEQSAACPMPDRAQGLDPST